MNAAARERGAAPASAVLELVRKESRVDPTPGVRALIGRIREVHGDALRAVVFYGSVLRTGDEENGLLDLMAIVDRYRPAYGGRRVPAAFNRLLPPNVFYLEAPVGGGAEVRCKYALVAADQLARLVGPRTRQVYFWGRLAQPCGVVWARDDAARECIEGILATAVTTFAVRLAPLVAPRFDGEELWVSGLTMSYGTELRAERRGVAERLVAAAPGRYRRMTAALAAHLRWHVRDGRYAPELPDRTRRRARRSWRLCRLQGKTLNVLRLIKAVFTFRGAVDYALWKVRRHSGVEVEVSERARRWPLVFGWPVLWRLWRQGALR